MVAVCSRPIRALAVLLCGAAMCYLAAGWTFAAPPRAPQPVLSGVRDTLFKQDAAIAVQPHARQGSTCLGGACLAASAACLLMLGQRSLQQAPREPDVAAAAVAEAEAKVAPKPKAKAKAKAKGKAKAKAKAKKPPVPLEEQVKEGIFAPVMIAGQAVVGDEFVVKARGKGIGLHSQAINAFCQRFAIPVKKRQGFIKTAKKTGHDLGFLLPGGHFPDGLFGQQALQLWEDWGISRW